MDKIDFTKYKRLFVFGCSFTAYYWPTWADILGIGFEEYYNFGSPGHGNHFIFQRFVEAYARYNIGPDDLVLIMWSSITREDRYIHEWKTLGSVFQNSELIDSGFVEKYCTPYGFLVRDLGYISAAKRILDGSHTDFEFLLLNSIVGDNSDGNISRKEMIDESFHYDETNLCNLYEDSINCFRMSFSKFIGSKWPGIMCYSTLLAGGEYLDYHPSSLMYYKYLQTVFPNTVFTENMRELVELSEQQVYKEKIFDIDTWKRSLPPTLIAKFRPDIKKYSLFNTGLTAI